MAKWNKKYIVTELKRKTEPAPWSQVFSDKAAMRLIALDSEVIAGAFCMKAAWFWPGEWPQSKFEECTVN